VRFDVVVEIPAGSRNKYEMDHELGVIRPGRTLFTATRDPATDPRCEHLQDIGDVPEHDRLEIGHFFEVCKDLEPGKSVEGASWGDRAEARATIQACQAAAIEY
jgi:inorganic pyrophosphatase